MTGILQEICTLFLFHLGMDIAKEMAAQKKVECVVVYT